MEESWKIWNNQNWDKPNYSSLEIYEYLSFTINLNYNFYNEIEEIKHLLRDEMYRIHSEFRGCFLNLLSVFFYSNRVEKIIIQKDTFITTGDPH